MKKFVRTEIGSEFWSIPVTTKENCLFPVDTAWFLSGRDALRAVIRDIQERCPFRSVALPSWCCDSIIEPFVSSGIEVYFYPVIFHTEKGLVKDFSRMPKCDGILLMDYFGYGMEDSLPFFDGMVIWDATHSVLNEIPDQADYVFGSLRKWAGFWTGGYAWRKDGSTLNSGTGPRPAPYTQLRQQAMVEKQAYWDGQREDKQHLLTFSAAEELLERGASGPADERDIRAAKRLDVAFLKHRRLENAACLLETVSDMALFPKLEETDCPMFVPIRVPVGKRDDLRRHLIQQDIYCPVHWPVSKLHRLTEQTRQIYEEELSLVCDQRYRLADMKRICAVINEFFEREN